LVQKTEERSPLRVALEEAAEGELNEQAIAEAESWFRQQDMRRFQQPAK